MQMNSQNKLLPATMVDRQRSFGDATSLKHTLDSLSIRDSSQDTRLMRFNQPRTSQSLGGSRGNNDSIQVRIRGKNNDVQKTTGSVTRTMD